MRAQKNNRVQTFLILIAMLLPTASVLGASLQFQPLGSIYADAEKIRLKHPEGVAVGSDGTLWVADTGNGRMVRYRLGDDAKSTEAAELKVPQITYPIKVEVDSQGSVYVLDGAQRRIVKLTPAGAFDGYLDPSGVPNAAAYIPRSLKVGPNDELYILDVRSARVLILDTSGQYRSHIDLPAGQGFFSDLSIDRSGRILLIDSVATGLYASNADRSGFSRLVEGMRQFARRPAALAVDKKSRIYVVDRNGGSVIIWGADGSFLSRQSAMGWKEGRLNYPSQLCVKDTGEVYVADTRNHRIQIFKALE